MPIFQNRRPKTLFGAAVSMGALIYHNIVFQLRSGHRNAFLALLLNILTALVLIASFSLFFRVLGVRGVPLRGDPLIFLMTGIFLFLTHVRTVAAVQGTTGAESILMQNAPMNTVISLTAKALAQLYLQTLTFVLILYGYHLGWGPIDVLDPLAVYAMLLIAWFTGVAVGIIFFALSPWFPRFVNIASMIYRRANMIASGKMFAANSLPNFMLPIFDWNPLFHTIDQARGFAFINYNPHYTSVMYPIYVGTALLLLGMLGEFYTRRNVSISWSATR